MVFRLSVHRLVTLLLCACVLISPLAIAQEVPSSESTVGVKSSPSEAIAALPRVSQELSDAIAASDLRRVNTAVSDLLLIGRRTNIPSFEEYGEILTRAGQRALRNADFDTAGFYARKVTEVAPHSPAVLLRSLDLVTATHTASLGSQLMAALWASLDQPDVVVRLLRLSLFPLLWSMTIALAITLLLALLLNPLSALTRSRDLVTRYGARPLTVPITVVGFLAPIAAGPLIALLWWGIVIGVLLPHRRVLTRWCGVVVILWAVLLPATERLNHFLTRSGGAAFFRAYRGEFAVGDLERLTALHRSRPRDGATAYLLAEQRVRSGDFAGALSANESAIKFLGYPAIADAQRGSILFLQGDLEGAARAYASAESGGGGSARFFYNLSRIKFEALDLEGSKGYFERAQRLDPVGVDALRAREDTLGPHSRWAIASIPLPLTAFLAAPFAEGSVTAETRAAERFAAVSPITAPLPLAALGVAVTVFGFRRRSAAPIEAETIFITPVRIVPGGSCLARGRNTVAALLATIATIISLPVIGWPAESATVYELLSGVLPYYLGTAMLYLLLVPWIGVEERGRR